MYQTFSLKCKLFKKCFVSFRRKQKTKHVFLQTNYEKLQLIQTIIRHTYKN